jgi:hypothetical protein
MSSSARVGTELADYRKALAKMTDDALCALYRDVSDEDAKLIRLEMRIRDHLAKQKAIRDAIREEWYLAAHADYLAAEAETNGYLLSRAGLAADVDPISLWSGPADRAYRYASEELRAFWDRRPRITITEYTRQATMRTA